MKAKEENLLIRKQIITFLFYFAFLIVSVMNVQSVKVKAETVTFDDGKLTYQITDEKKQTVELVGSLRNITDTKLIIPNKVSYKGTTYTVTSIDYDSEGYYNTTVTEIVVPETIVADVVIRNSEMSDIQYENNDPDSNVPFQMLHKITFLAQEIPTKIQVQAYLYDSDFIIEVPAGQEELYAKRFGTLKLLAINFYDRIDGDHGYYTYNVEPIILSSTQKAYEPRVFHTDHGIYLVTKSAKDGQGEVKLVRCQSTLASNPFKTVNSGNYVYPDWSDETIETEVISGNYHYTVTSLAKNALSEVTPTVLTIPDTITQMDTPCINPAKLRALFLSKNCIKVDSRLFAIGEFDDTIPLIYIPSGIQYVEENALYGTRVGRLVIPSTIKLSSSVKQRVDRVSTYQVNTSDIPAESLATANTTVSAKVKTKKQLHVIASNTDSTDTINYVSMDNGTALVTEKGLVTPAHHGAGFIVAYSVLSGKHQIIKVDVQDQTFTNGIFTYRINYSTKKTVTLIGCKPKKNTTAITIPSTVTYKKVKYTVTKVCAGKSIIDNDHQWDYTNKNGYVRTYDYDAPLIKDSVAKVCKVTQITVPSTVTTIVSNFGNLTKLKKVIFNGKKAPKTIALSVYNLQKATLYVPRYYIKNYKNTEYRYSTESVKYYFKRWDESCLAKIKSK